MERLIDIKHVLIINVEQFDILLNSLGIELLHNNDSYMPSLILTNIFAYVVIVLFIQLLIKITKTLFKSRRRFI